MSALRIGYDFAESDLVRLLVRASRNWGLDDPSITVSFEKATSRATASLSFKRRGKFANVQLSPEAVDGAISQASAAEGNPIDPTTLTYSYFEGSGHCGGSRISAKAKQGVAPEKVAQEPGRVTFPGTATMRLGIDELEEVLKRAAQRAGHDVSSASVSHSNDDPMHATASISTKRGGQSAKIELDSAELDETIIEEMKTRGYSVQPGIEYSTSPGGFASRYGTSAKLTLTVMPK